MSPIDAKIGNDDESVFDGISATYRSKLPIATQVHDARRDVDRSTPLYSQSKGGHGDNSESLEDNRAVEVLSRR